MMKSVDIDHKLNGKKIAFFTNMFPGRISTFISRDIYMLLQRGFQVDIFPIYPYQENNWKWVPQNYRATIRNNVNIRYLSPININKEFMNNKSEIIDLLRESMHFGYKQMLKTTLVILQAVNWIREFDGCYNYMISYWGNYAGTYAYLANKGLHDRIPFSFFLHAGTDLYRDQIHLEEKIKYATNVVTVCEFNKKYLEKLYPKSFPEFRDKLFIYHLGLDLEDISLNLDNRDPLTLLTIGSLYAQKGFSSVVIALSKLIAEFPEIKLVMVGDGPERKKLAQLANQLGVRQRIFFAGQLPFEDVKSYLSTSTVLVHPSSGLGDAVPTVIKEALASGLPIIGSSVAGIPELLDYGNAGMIIPENDIDSLVNAIQELLRNPKVRKEYSEKGREFAEKKFNIYDNFTQLIQNLKLG